MSTEQANDGKGPPAPTAEPPAGVLAALPRTRPQRASARRAAARARTQSETAPPRAPRASANAARGPEKKQPRPTEEKPAKQAASKPASAKRASPARRKPPRAPRRGQIEERAPKQGYEPEEEVELGATVHPPSGSELVESIADIFGELAGAGAGAGGRLLKDALSVFRRP